MCTLFSTSYFGRYWSILAKLVPLPHFFLLQFSNLIFWIIMILQLTLLWVMRQPMPVVYSFVELDFLLVQCYCSSCGCRISMHGVNLTKIHSFIPLEIINKYKFFILHVSLGKKCCLLVLKYLSWTTILTITYCLHCLI